MIRNFQIKMEEKHMESLYCLMNINTERKEVKSKKTLISCHLHPLPQIPKVVYDIVPPQDTGPHLLCQLLLWISRGGGNDLKTFPFSIRYNGKTYAFSSKFYFNNEWNSVKCRFLRNLTRILQNSSKLAEKLRNWFYGLHLGPLSYLLVVAPYKNE